MEFHSLTRRDLQSLCKKNKIPANMTNIAMADALKSLEIVEGFEEFLLPKESESAQSAIESPEKSEVTSPYVPPTGGRSTRQRTIAKNEPQTLHPMTRTRGTARKTQAKNKEESRADATETPAVAAQTTRRRFPVASACRKMDSQLRECAEEKEKKGVPMTPVALEVTSRRRGVKKESEVRQVYSTRRSARLAEKNVEILIQVKNEKSEILKSDLFMEEEGENLEMNVKQVLDDVHEVSEITGVDVETCLEDNSTKMDCTEVSSGQKQDMSDENYESNVEEKMSQDSETEDPNLEMDRCIDDGDEQLNVHYEAGSELDGERADETEPPSNCGNDGMTLNESNVEEKLSQNSETDDPCLEVDLCIDAGDEQLSIPYETGSELDGERADETEPSNGGNVTMTQNESIDFEDEDGSPDVCSFESKSGFENTTELNTHKDADEADYTVDHGVENISSEKIVEVDQDEVGEENETNLINEEEQVEKTLCYEIEGIEIAAEEVPVNVLDSINLQLYGSETAAVESLHADFLESNVEERQDEVGDKNKSNLTKDTEFEKSSSRVEHSLGKNLCHEVENLPIEASEKAADDKPSSDAVLNVLASIKNSQTQDLGGLESAATVHSPMLHQNADFLKGIETSGIESEPGIPIPPRFTGINSSFITQLSLPPTKKSASKASATVEKTADVSDNKENIGSCGSKLVLTKERVNIVDIAENVDKNMSGLSMRKLSKMLKEKLQITNKLSQDDNNALKAITTRVALQVLPENRLGNETEN